MRRPQPPRGEASRSRSPDSFEPTPLLRNAAPEPKTPELPGTGAASHEAVAVTVRRQPQSRSVAGRVRREWELVFDASSGPKPDPLMGWSQTSDPLAGHTVAFHTAEAAIAFAERKGWAVRLIGGGHAV